MIQIKTEMRFKNALHKFIRLLTGTYLKYSVSRRCFKEN